MARQANRPRLGKGLSSLIPESPQPTAPGQYLPDAPPPSPSARTSQAAEPTDPQPHSVVMLAIDKIAPNPRQPRRRFEEAPLRQLADTIARHGLLQPVLVTPVVDAAGQQTFVLIAGERRLRAAELAGVKRIPAIVRPASGAEMLELALVENLHRADLNPIERASAYRDLMDRFGLTQQQVGDRVGSPRATVANYLRLLDLCDDVQRLVLDGALTFGHARALAGLAGSAERQRALAQRAVKDELSVREVEAEVARLARGGAPQPGKEGQTPPAKSPYIADVERQLTEAVGTRVSVRPLRTRGRGRIVIDYYSLDDFDRIVGLLGLRIDS